MKKPGKYMEFVVDWSLPRDAFRAQVRGVIFAAESAGKVIVLPVGIVSGQEFVGVLSTVLSQLHCDGCDANCCKRNPDGSPNTLRLAEYDALVKKYGGQHFSRDSKFGHMPMPCPFLCDDRCTIYDDRPLVCAIYPFQPGGYIEGRNNGNEMISLGACCPEARRIAELVYMQYWDIRKRFLNAV